MTWQEQLKHLRKFYTVKELCKKAHTSPNIIVALERGEYNPSDYQLFKLNKVYEELKKNNPIPNKWKKELKFLCSRNKRIDVAEMLNCDYKYINRWLKDNNYPNKKYIDAIHSAYQKVKMEE